MLLDLWFGFWTEADWVPAPPEPEPEQRPVGKAGGWHRRGDYARLDDDFWAVRERYLTWLARALDIAPAPPTPSTPPPVAAKVERLVTKRRDTFHRAQAAANHAALKKLGAEVAALTVQLTAARARDDEDILAAILPYL